VPFLPPALVLPSGLVTWPVEIFGDYSQDLVLGQLCLEVGDGLYYLAEQLELLWLHFVQEFEEEGEEEGRGAELVVVLEIYPADEYEPGGEGVLGCGVGEWLLGAALVFVHPADLLLERQAAVGFVLRQLCVAAELAVLEQLAGVSHQRHVPVRVAMSDTVLHLARAPALAPLHLLAQRHVVRPQLQTVHPLLVLLRREVFLAVELVLGGEGVVEEGVEFGVGLAGTEVLGVRFLGGLHLEAVEEGVLGLFLFEIFGLLLFHGQD